MLKKILAGFALLIVLLAIGLYFLGSNLDSFVRTAIEKYGTAATQTTVKLDGVKITLTSGEAALAGLSIGSPAGFTADKSFYLGKIAVKLDANSIAGTGPIVIDEIDIVKPQITYEVNKNNEVNLKTIANNAQAYAASFGGGKKEASSADDAGKKPGRKVVIKSLTLSNGQVAILHPLLQGKQLSAGLPTIHLTNIGKSEGGASPAEIADQLLGAITSSASQVASSDLVKQFGSNLKDAASGIVGAAKDNVGSQIQGLFGK